MLSSVIAHARISHNLRRQYVQRDNEALSAGHLEGQCTAYIHTCCVHIVHIYRTIAYCMEDKIAAEDKKGQKMLAFLFGSNAMKR